jgi:uncharacterized protein (DUF1778 family)
MAQSVKAQARFNARLPQEQKLLLEEAACLGGYRNLTDFIMLTAQEKAKEIIREKERIIASERDARIFFEVISKPKQPSARLKKALEAYRSYMPNLKHPHGRTTQQKPSSH